MPSSVFNLWDVRAFIATFELTLRIVVTSKTHVTTFTIGLVFPDVAKSRRTNAAILSSCETFCKEQYWGSTHMQTDRGANTVKLKGVHCYS